MPVAKWDYTSPDRIEATFAAIEPADVEALCACIDHVVDRLV